MKNIIIFVLIFVFFAGNTLGDYPTLTPFVTDNANLLSSMEEDALNNKLASIMAETTVEIAIVTVPDTGGEDTVLYASRVGAKNNVGKAATDNGVVILWSIGDDKGGAIATGRGIESVLTDSKVGRIGRGSSQFFDKGSFYQGFEYIVDEIHKEVIKEVIEEPSKPTPISTASIIFFFIILIIIAVIIFITQRKKGDMIK